ncbi:MAG: hypothetical protein JWO89_278 [Verrucomicrobiaceae bacterium]|nr:hypothetical protein [Verrucomicrobiaceae bacterium]MDB6120446.1 hypothetical protein [Verrucomicrobiaceae bacterium]
MSWKSPLPNWNTVAGRVLDTFFAAVHEALPSYDLPLTVFGSTPIQLCLDEAFTSADVDIMVLDEDERLREIAIVAGIGRAGLNPTFGVQICPPHFFRTTPHYLQRAHAETRHGLRVIVPHPRDILVGKLHRARTDEQMRLVSKDRRAFQRVRELCDGHPTKDEFLEDLISCEPDFRPVYDGGVNVFRLNVEDALSEVYGHAFDLQHDILDARKEERAPAAEHNIVSEMIRQLRPSRE